MTEDLFNRWILSEESKEGIKTYHTLEHSNGKDSGKQGFEIKKNGEFVIYTKSASGISIKNVGHFEIKGNTVYVYFKDHYSDFMFTIVSVDKESLNILQ